MPRTHALDNERTSLLSAMTRFARPARARRAPLSADAAAARVCAQVTPAALFSACAVN